MWLPNEVISAVDEIAHVYYIDVTACQKWNTARGEGELRLLTGWCWETKDKSRHQQGFKTMTVAYRDAWYQLIAKRRVKVIPFRRSA